MRATFSNLRLIFLTILTSIYRQRYTLEAAIVGLFFVQALRFLIGELYARISSATIYPAIDPALITANTPGGLIPPSTVGAEITLLGYMLLLPLLTLVLGRFHFMQLPALIVAVVGRALMTMPNAPITQAAAAAIAVGGGMWYIAMMIRQRSPLLPYLFVLAFGVDQLLRAFGDTLDPTWSTSAALVLFGLPMSVIIIGVSVFTVLLGLYNIVRRPEDSPLLGRGLMPFWAGPGLGGLLFLEISLLATPSAVAARANADYTIFVPFLVVGTFLPLIPLVRGRARAFIALFDSGVRGWSWMLVVALLVVFGTRFQGLFGGTALVMAQFSVSMMFWWLARPQAENERNFSGLWIIFAVLTFAVLVVFDLFTFEYAYVRDFAAPLTFLNPIIPPLQRGFRGLGLAVLLLGVFIGALPMVQTRQRIPWAGGTVFSSVLMIIVVAAAGGYAAYVSRPPLVSAVRNVESIRVATYNIHGGYNEFFDFDMDAIATAIQRSGADIVLLQEVEKGRMTSYGVDQPLWLARELARRDPSGQGYDVRYFPTNESLQGLAILSKVEIVFSEGHLLTSVGQQTGLQRIQVQPDEGILTVYNTWLGLLVEGDIPAQEQDQQRQLSEMFTLIAAAHPGGNLGRMIVGGTFNNVPDSPLLLRMATETPFLDPFADEPLTTSATLVRTGQRARYDYLWTNLLALGKNVIDSSASDHRPAVIEVRIAR